MSELGMVISEDEFVRASKLHGKPTRGIWILYAVVVVAAIAAVILGSERLQGFAISALLGGAVGVTLFTQILCPIWARRHFRKSPSMHQPFDVSLSPEGIHFKSANGEGRLIWSHVVQWRQNSEFLLIYFTPALHYIVPRRLEASGLDVSRLMGELQKHVGPAK
ncbi:MAG: YcxB family protein [Xanthomonadales bacterium]|jgi:amino acid transporter|nr:YcxB family protein [Xanthomonadales bacterium]